MKKKTVSTIQAQAILLGCVGVFLSSHPAFALGSNELERSAPMRFDLKHAVQYALDHSLDYDSSKKGAVSAELDLKSRKAAFLPTLDFTTTDGLLGASGSPPGTSPWTNQAQLSLNENLYDNGSSITQYRISDLSKQLAEVNQLKSRDQVSLDVASEFYHFSLLSELLVVKKQQHDLFQKQYERVSNQYRQGLSTRQDFLRLKTQIQRADLDLYDTKNQMDQSIAKLKRLLSGSQNISESLLIEFQPLHVTESQIVFPAHVPHIEDTFDFLISKFKRQINNLNVDFVERKYWPVLNVTANGTYSYISNSNTTTSTPSTGQLSWNALVNLQYNLWDWGTRRRGLEAARLNADIQNNSLDSNLLEGKRGIEVLFLNLGVLNSTYRLTRELLVQTRASYELLDQQYRLGQATYLDLALGLGDLLDAETRYYTAYFDVLGNLAQYRFYERRLYDWISETH